MSDSNSKDISLYFSDGYLFFCRTKSDLICPVHNLVAIADGADPHKVFDDAYNVHHKDGSKINNAPENLQLLTIEEHAIDYEDNLRVGTETPDWHNEDKIRELYHENGMTQSEIAEEFDVGQSAVRDVFDKFEIETRGRGRSKPQPWKDEDTLIDLYVKQDMTQKEVAEELDTTPQTLRKWLNKYDINKARRV